jgi:hypothetical protein
MNDLTHAVQFFQTGYTILLALAFGEALKQFVPDGDQIIRWDRLPSLLAFLFMIFPFFHGMSRYFYITYLHTPDGRLAPVAFYIMLDGMVFMTMAAFFFVMSRSLSPGHWKRFYFTLLTLLAVDTAWIGVSLIRGVPVLPWLELNAILAVVLIGVLLYVRSETSVGAPRICAVVTFATTIASYVWMSDFYFP